MGETLDLEKFHRAGKIRFASREDIPAIMDFIERYWAEGHILARDREIFEFQYVYGDEVCFVLDEEAESGGINGLLGYIPYGCREEGPRDLFTAVWKVKKSSGFMQGTELICFLEKNGNCKNLYCAGLASRVVSIMKYMRKRIADFSHYYYLNPAVTKFRIGVIPDALRKGPDADERPGTGPASEKDTDVSFCPVTEFSQIEELLRAGEGRRFPYKSPEFVKHRYFEHPEYTYDKWRVRMGSKEAVLICRTQEAEGSRIYRVIDLLGELECIAGCGGIFQRIFEENKKKPYEYADCLVCGIEDAWMRRAGFLKREEGDGSVLPNYFEPFEQKNVTIHNFMPGSVPAVLFKGDGDQDRPSIREKTEEVKQGK